MNLWHHHDDADIVASQLEPGRGVLDTHLHLIVLVLVVDSVDYGNFRFLSIAFRY
jgi:hypothetical protein